MIEKILYDHLSQKLDVDVSLEQPDPKPAFYVLIEKTGSRKVNHINSSTVAVQSYGPTLLDAATLNEEVKEAVESAIELNDVYHVQLDSDYNFTDTARKMYRYQAVYDITHN